MDFQSRLNHVGNRLNAVNGELVTLERNGNQTPDITASPVLMKAEEIIPGIAVTRVDYQAFGMDVADYVINGTAVTPEIGDTITRADGTVFRLVSLGADEPPYQYTTSSRTRYFLHTERVL